MSIEAVTALSNALSAAQLTSSAAAPASSATNVGFDALVRSLTDINAQMTQNQQAIEALAVGKSDDLHRVIMNLESTKLSFDLMLQVRNKVLDAYQELLRMQV